MHTYSPLLQRLACGCLLIATAIASGCATTAAPTATPVIDEATTAPEPMAPEFIPVVRYGRYTLVELAPDAAQRDLLLQVVDVVVPEDARATVGDGLRHVLKRSGYQLCQAPSAVIRLYSLPLPAAHLRLGPLTLRDALLTLAGSSWDLHIDDTARQVCFVRAGTADSGLADNEAAFTEAVQVFPLTEGDQP